MAELPNPQSYEAILSDMLSAYAAKQGIDDFNVGSAITSFFEVASLSTARTSGDIFQILRDFSVDRATGDALKRLAAENRVTLITAKPSTGFVTVSDPSFQKISTKVYAGSNPPNVGSTQVKVSDASGFSPTGNIYIGRGTPNVEGPISYSSISSSGSFYVINLSSPTTKFHNVGESVILAQGGNRPVPANNVVVSPSTGASQDIQFSVVIGAVILDGETEVKNVQVNALNPGASGNVPRGAIKQFSSPPFANAKVTNELPFTTGRDSETDDELRVRIKRAIASIGLGTATVIKSSVIGATPTDEQATIVSSEIVQNSDGAILYIDDGAGYEAKTSGIGLETITDSALGGEKFFQLSTGGRQAPIAKAFLQSTFFAPFDLVGGDALAITVGEQTYEHVFADTDFRSPGGATAFEVTASINANTALGFEATTSEGGQLVTVRAKLEGNDSLKTATPSAPGRNASTLLGFPSNEIQTLRLFKNKVPLSKDGNSASVFTQGQQLWSPSIANGDTLVISVDKTSFITYSILDSDFISTGTYTSVASTNSLDSWVKVLNSKITGATVVAVGQQLLITSNLGASDRASLEIDQSSTLVTKGMFSTSLGLQSQGKKSDFVLSRNTAQFELNEPLAVGDELTGGSGETEARIQSNEIPGGSITLASDGYIWILIDTPGTVVPTGVAGNSLLSVEKPSTNIVRYGTTIPNAFDNVLVGDYVIIWSEDLVASNRIEGRINAVTSTSLDILVTPAEWSAVSPTAGVLYSDGLVVLRTDLPPQKFKVTAGTKTLVQISQELQAQTQSLAFSVAEEQYLVVRTRTKDQDGRILVVTADPQGKLLNLPLNASDVSKDSLIAFYESGDKEAQFPLFIHGLVATGTSADPINSFISSFVSSVSLAGRDPNEIIGFLHPYGGKDDSQPAGESAQESSISGANIGLVSDALVRRLRDIDRYYIASPLDFGANDTSVVILDNDTGSKSFEIPFFRKAKTNTTLANNPNNFNAYDIDSGATSQFSAAFGSFDFSNFKVLMQARNVLKHQASETALLYRSSRFGRSGNHVNVGYIYPTSSNQPLSQVVVVNQEVTINIGLKSGPSVASAIDSSTEWNVSVTPNTPSAGVDQVTYTWSGVGTSPSLSLSGGEYVNIGSQTEFDPKNTGIFRVSDVSGFTPTPTSFSVQNKNGISVSQSNASTLVNGQIEFYESSDTTATEINDYVNDNLSDYLSSSIVNDGGTTGEGVIEYSTYEDSGFAHETIFLMDGINWLASSNLSGSPQFVFKKPLDLPSAVGYTFNSGEEIRFVPTTTDQVKRLISVLAVTGFTTVGSVNLVDRGSRVELSTNILGSEGSIQIIGGLANGYQVPVLDTASRIDNEFSSISADKAASLGVQSDQWFKLQASTAQRKEALLGSNTSVTVLGNNPTVGQSTISLSGRTSKQRYFGKPRHHVRSIGRTFRIEKHGSLVCMSWDGQGSSPEFERVVSLNDASGGTVNIEVVNGDSELEFTILSGDTNFTEVSIGDIIEIKNFAFPDNNGTFLVTGVGLDGKSLTVLNQNGENAFSFGTLTFTGNLTSGDQFDINGIPLVAGTDFAIGSDKEETAENFTAVAGTVSGVTASVNGDIVTITATSPNVTVPISYTGTAVVTVSSAFLEGVPFASGDFSCSTQVSEGDTVTIKAPFAVLNRGQYRVIRRYNDSIWYENANVVEEEITISADTVSLGITGTTELDVDTSNNSAKVIWNGSGTEPHLENASMGDIVTFGTDFDPKNQGEFMVLRSGKKMQEITKISMPAGSLFSSSGPGKYFEIYSAGDAQGYYVWYSVSGGNADPVPAGLTGIAVSISPSDTPQDIAQKTSDKLNIATGLISSYSENIVTVTTVGSEVTSPAVDVGMPAPFSMNIEQKGRRTFLECINAEAVAESGITVSDVFTCDSPQIQFLEYEATLQGDQFVSVGDTLGQNSAGSRTIVRVVDQDTAVVSGTMASIISGLSGRESSVFVLEGVPYSGYKHVVLVATQPGSPYRNQIVFDTNAQYSKINEAASVSIVSLNKSDYTTTIKKGLDSYRYNTGLIAEANRIIYGDPRDPSTYPGVGAAGAEIFVAEPLARRVQVSIDVRINTGVPFAQTAEQVRTSVSSLINSNPIGQPISISSIVSAVNSIPGVRAVAISSPQYDSTHDIIFIAPSEKARIIDPTLDVSVNQTGQ